ncbi:MAG: precorrin-8X methylmutase [Desulfobacula sp.]|jgi:precorrin-8X/cobalt-precorrin-8 methylmutase|uniref:precorrin-8X methylmutase n=1 Tax=Desulfobacula sp. TaxID=2593537 RepID=UPI001E093278|nr:precorrin-8X methylmutase [Desulfobacula sp.]MBT3483995.1 precorrin-8X methylmutase [Desulfobacula sp.]MBT3803818.1 precorrin-8X methylmutase [Desulfobacula sp.]MBT4023763.1 precorrin-8X methylmutase [Desulfobacula sp.]MBT4197677.1 precorrin-8X methylmutase [Desulfobacula sp.]
MKPQEIENLSFKIIEQEAGDHAFSDDQWPIVRRMIHTSADFEYMNTIRFYPDAVKTGIKAIQQGCQIFTDTNMARVGIRKKEINEFGGKVSCLIADKDVANMAKEKGTTRALAAVDMACDRMKGGIYVVGNAPTALLRLIELIKEKKASPALVIGFPVGFVNAAESKDELMTLDFPYITNKGRKGGSNLAAAIVNALAIMANEHK